ncbi:expressed unknown protein [Seminavis robusta]|uniref:Uncharacterized protein n=1 Tax=Seminavis robusta TaxID=568900 RepID=A0A9N8HC65_9STRA|nr:expressed unknown protein [Seminavis robusta]|eukprot:Sro208_g087100.1 n/a (246) ;mRNA; r:56530-57267
MGVSMDTFIKALLVERSQSDRTFAPLVVDNARHHAERWSELPRRVRTSLLLNNVDPTRIHKAANRKFVGRSNSLGSEDRWTSCGDSSPKQQRRPNKQAAAPLAPPACPQRQQSIEVTAETLALMGACSDTDCAHLAPSCPQRRKSVEISHISPNSVMMLPPNLPKMPERKSSEDSDLLYSSVPPPPMTIQKKNNTAPLLGSFSSSVKRSSSSLLDDDSDSDEEEFMGGSTRFHNPKPQLLKNFTF